MQITTASKPLKINSKSIFLAGSIEQDKATRWQDEVISFLAKSF